jgi:uncharacterized protein (DUF697 family)
VIKPIEHAVVRILKPGAGGAARPEGAGFLIDRERHVLSCEHVVSACLLPQAADEAERIVEVDFPFITPPSGVIQARVDFLMHDEGQDVAGLTLLSEPPAAAQPATLIERDQLREHRFKAYGAGGKDGDGEWSFGVIRPGLGDNYIQLEAISAQGRRVRKGYSGSAVYDLDAHGVAGMVVKADSVDAERVAVMLPTKLLLKTWSDVLTRAVVPENPYRGMNPFEEDDATVFFGREDVTQHLVGRVESSRFAALVTESGTGKSSLLRAGLVPSLRDKKWAVLHVTGATRDPFERFAQAIIKAELDSDSPFTERSSELARTLAKSGLRDEVDHYGEKAVARDLLVIIDQMEELFTICRDEEKREQFLDHLADLTLERRRGERRIVVLVALRSDYCARLEAHKRFKVLLSDGSFGLPTLDRSALRRVIEEPASSVGVRFEDGLVDAIIADVQHQPAALPLLEFTLTLLWHEQTSRMIPLAAYRRLGGVRKALELEAERVYIELDSSEKEAARRVFVQLVNLSKNTKGTRRPLTRSDLLKNDWCVVEKLAYHMLVTIGADSADRQTAQLAHEALVDAWPRLNEWVNSTAEQVWRLDRDAGRIVRQHVAGAIAAAAVPWGDIAAAALLYASMGQKIGRVYGIDLDRDAAKRVALTMATGVGAVGASWCVVANTFKSTGFGYVASWIIEAPLLSASTMAAGSALQYYFRIQYLGGGVPSLQEMGQIVREDARNRLRRLPAVPSRSSFRRRRNRMATDGLDGE